MSKDNQKTIRQHCRGTRLGCRVYMTRQGKGSFLYFLFKLPPLPWGMVALRISSCDYLVPLTSMTLASPEDAEQPSSDL